MRIRNSSFASLLRLESGLPSRKGRVAPLTALSGELGCPANLNLLRPVPTLGARGLSRAWICMHLPPSVLQEESSCHSQGMGGVGEKGRGFGMNGLFPSSHGVVTRLQ